MGVLTRNKARAEAVTAFTLYLFTTELPDSEQELFFQSPHHFHLFRKLPSEIRTIIWSFTFPKGRHYFDYHRKIYQCRRKTGSVRASIICQESRQEFLRHYIKILSKGCKHHAGIPRFWNPAIEPIRTSIAWDMDAAWDDLFITPYEILLSSIQILELETRCWCTDNMITLADCIHADFHHLTALKEVRIINIGPKVNLWDTLPPGEDDTRGELCLDFILGYFDSRPREERKMIPKISIVTNRTKEVNLVSESFEAVGVADDKLIPPYYVHCA